MTTVTFRNGFTVSDDNDSSTTLKNGGHRTRFVPALEGVVLAADESKKWSNLLGTVVYDAEYSAKEYAVGNTCPTGSAKSWATGNGVIAGGVYSAKYYAEQAQTFSNSAVNAPGTSATSTSPLTIGTGSKTLDIQPGKAFTPGQFVIIADQTTPANYMVGQITAHNNITGSLTVNVTVVGGVGVGLMNWIVSLTALANAAGAATLGGNNTYSGTNTYTATTTFNANVTAVNLTTSGLLSATGTVDLSGTSAKRSRTSGASDFVVENTGVTSADSSTLKLKTPNKTWTFGTLGDTNSFYLTDGTVNLIDYLPSTDKTVIRKPQRTDAAVAANDLVRKAELDNATVESIITTTQGALSGFRNKIINGGMLISQRGVSATVPGTNTTTNNVYGVFDRWFINANVPQSVTTNFVSNNEQAVCTLYTNTGFTCGTNNFVSGFTTKLESADVYSMLASGKPITLSFMFARATNGTFSVKLKDLTTSLEMLKTFTYTGSGNFQKITITFPSALTVAFRSTNFALELNICGVGGSNYRRSADSDWTASTNAVMVTGTEEWTNSTQVLRVYNVQLEQGSVATPFEQRPYAVELALCQRYYETGSYKVFTAGATSISGAVSFKVNKRSTPSLSYSTAANRNSPPSVGAEEWIDTESFGVTRTGADLAFKWVATSE
jgi:hypothetical protein